MFSVVSFKINFKIVVAVLLCASIHFVHIQTSSSLDPDIWTVAGVSARNTVKHRCRSVHVIIK